MRNSLPGGKPFLGTGECLPGFGFQIPVHLGGHLVGVLRAFLQYGDHFYIHAWGVTYTYEVRENRRVSSEYKNITTKHEDFDWVTLITCEDFNAQAGTYSYRRVVRAVFVNVE